MFIFNYNIYRSGQEVNGSWPHDSKFLSPLRPEPWFKVPALSFFAHLAERPHELFPSLVVRRLLAFHIWLFSSETTWPNKAKFYRKHLRKVRYKISSFHPNWTKNMIPMSNSSFWLAEIKKKIFSETRRNNKLLLCADHTTNMATIVSSCLIGQLKKNLKLIEIW